MRRVLLCAGLVLLASACEGESRRMSIELVLASQGLDGKECAAPTGALNAVSWARIEAFRSCEGTDCSHVDLASAVAGHGSSGVDAIVVPVQDRSIGFDLKSTGGGYDLHVELFDGGCAPLGDGWARDLDVLAETVTVAVYPFERASCLRTSPTPRALHAAVRLPNNEVLIFGGVTADGPVTAIQNPSGETGFAAASGIEVYLPDQGRFETVEVVRDVGEDGACAGPWDGFARVFFSTQQLSDAQATEYVVRVFGGFGPGGTYAAVLDGRSLGFNAQGALLLPALDARAMPPVDLVFDPARRQVRVECVGDAEAWQEAGFVAATPVGDSAAALLSVTAAGGAAGARTLTLARTIGWYATAVSTSSELAVARFGATIAPWGEGSDGVFVWGGNIESELEAVLSEAGELIDVSGDHATTALDATALGLPRPSAYHTATALGEEGVVVAGGCNIDPEGDTVITTAAADSPLWVAVPADAGVGKADVDESGADYTSSLFHAAVRLDDAPAAAGSAAVLIVGGTEASAATTTPAQRLARATDAAAQQVVLVRSRSDGQYETVPLMSSPDATHGLLVGRWGHTATALVDGRILVVGGFTSAEGPDVQVVSVAEVLSYAAAPDPVDVCGGS